MLYYYILIKGYRGVMELLELTLIARNIGKFNLPHIWDRVLLKTPGLNLKRHAHVVGHVNSNNSNTPL